MSLLIRLKTRLKTFIRKEYIVYIFLLSIAGCLPDAGKHIELKENWSYAIGVQGLGPDEIKKLNFKPVKDLAKLAECLPERSGILYLKKRFLIPIN